MGLGWQEILIIALLPVIALTLIGIALVSKSRGAVMECPQCAETIKRRAKICRFCRYTLQ
jgi:hypothetical protein